MRTVKAGLLGLGTVGGGVYKLIEKQKEEMGAKTGAHVEIAGILVYNLNKKPFHTVFVHRDAVDDVMFYGRGAGELPTASVFGAHKVSINKVVQKIVTDGIAELVIVIDAVKEYHMQNALDHLMCMKTVKEISSVIREY